MARPRSSASASASKSNTNEGENKMADTKGSLGSLKMVEVADEVLDAARGGRGHGEYDGFIDQFLQEGIRGTEVGYDGVKANSVKTGLKSAIERAVKADKVKAGELQVKGKDEHVYLVKGEPTAAE